MSDPVRLPSGGCWAWIRTMFSQGQDQRLLAIHVQLGACGTSAAAFIQAALSMPVALTRRRGCGAQQHRFVGDSVL